MIHNDKSKALVGRRRVPCWLSKKMQSIPVCLGSKEGRGAGRKPPPARSLRFSCSPLRSLGEALELPLALLHKLLGGPQLVAHDAQQLLRLLQEIEID